MRGVDCPMGMYDGLLDGPLNEPDAKRMLQGVELSADRIDGDSGVRTSILGGGMGVRTTCDNRE